MKNIKSIPNMPIPSFFPKKDEQVEQMSGVHKLSRGVHKLTGKDNLEKIYMKFYSYMKKQNIPYSQYYDKLFKYCKDKNIPQEVYEKLHKRLISGS